MIIDFHTHAFPDFLAPRALSALTENSTLTPFHDGTVSGLVREMDAHGVDISVLLSIATKPTQESSVNTFAISLLEHKRIIPFGSVYPGSDTWEYQIDRLHDAGIRGIKLHPEYQSFDADCDDALKIYRKCGKLGLIVAFHSGLDESYSPPAHTSPESVNKICSLCPDTVFVAAHFGGYNMWDEFSAGLEYHDNLYLDTAMTRTQGIINTRTALQTVEKMGVSHILLGSDSPWEKQCDSICGIKSLGLSDDENRLVFSENAIKLLGLETAEKH